MMAFQRNFDAKTRSLSVSSRAKRFNSLLQPQLLSLDRTALVPFHLQLFGIDLGMFNMLVLPYAMNSHLMCVLAEHEHTKRTSRPR